MDILNECINSTRRLILSAVSFCFTGELAYHGHRVKVYDRSRQALERASNVLEEHKEQLRREECMITPNFVVRLIQQYQPCYKK